MAGLMLASISNKVFGFGLNNAEEPIKNEQKIKLRFAIASDGHYGQSGTDFKNDHENLIRWINQSHDNRPIDLVIFNGDLVHDQPALLKVVKSNYFDRLKMPYHAIPENHDHADAEIWQSVFGYPDNYTFEKMEWDSLWPILLMPKVFIVAPKMTF